MGIGQPTNSFSQPLSFPLIHSFSLELLCQLLTTFTTLSLLLLANHNHHAHFILDSPCSR